MEIINPFYLYLILQLDSIKDLLGGPVTGFPLLFGSIAFVIATCAQHLFAVEELTEKEAAGLGKLRRILAGVLITCGLAQAGNAFLPTSERMAVLVVLPAVANNEAVQTEAKEVYELAKRGLAKLIETETTPTTEKNE